DRACFGEKDWQQLQVVRRVVADLHLPLRIVGVPTVREPDGLALSSRNRFLSPAERVVAPRLFPALQAAARDMAGGDRVEQALRSARTALEQAGFEVEYLALVDGATMRPLEATADNARLIAAARLGSVRLIDNLPA
ncbi:MAG TPA: pantoate--beta-alanine ligase, partial [Acetobacteraceae bacterium]|nr:pantoate--beta-alanine ligase [Acetobacteraceae bacterium]